MRVMLLAVLPLAGSCAPRVAVGLPGLSYAQSLSDRLYCGGTPEGDAGFASLASLGVKTIICVEGAAPDVAAARRAGIRTVHLPIGYGDIPKDRAAMAVKAARELPGPVYIHCHHGVQRAPAMAAIVAVAVEGWDRRRALSWMRDSGTSLDYAALYRSVERFDPPTEAQTAALPADFPERAAVTGLADRMASIDREFDKIKAAAARGFPVMPVASDRAPAHAALMLAEHFRESVRLGGPDRPDEFGAQLAGASRIALALREEIRRRRPDRQGNGQRDVMAAFARMRHACKTCHRKYRD